MEDLFEGKQPLPKHFGMRRVKNTLLIGAYKYKWDNTLTELHFTIRRASKAEMLVK